MNTQEKKPKVSVCVVTYNQEKYIRQCLQSIIDQKTNFDFEVIVGDDCSTDGTPAIVREFVENYPKIVRGVFREKNIGAAKNYLNIHNSASGEYIAHMDGDDFWLPNKLELQIDFLKTNPECSAVYANAIVVTEFNKSIGFFNGKLPNFFNTEYLLERGNFLNHSSFVYHSSIRSKILDFKGEFIDYRVHLRCSLCGRLGYINEVLVGYRRMPTGMASSSSAAVSNLYWEALLEMHETKNTPDISNAASDFLASIICGGLRRKNFSQIIIWNKKIKSDIGKSYIRVLISGLIKVIPKMYYYGKKFLFLRMGKMIIFSMR